MELKSGLRKILREAVLSAFPNPDDLKMAVQDAIDKNLHEIVGQNLNLVSTVDSLIEWARARERLIEFFAKATQISGNAELQKAYATLMTEGSIRHQISPVSPTGIRHGFEALVLLMGNPEVHDAVLSFRHDFRDVTQQLQMIRAYKDLHDGLHELQLRCLDQIIIELPTYPDDLEGRDNVIQYLVCLQTASNDIARVVAENHLRPEETRWVEELLMPARRSMESAVDELDHERLSIAVRRLSQVLNVKPALINSWLYRAARDLRLGNLVKELRQIVLSITEFAEQENIAIFRNGLERLEVLDARLNDLVIGHNLWQEIDDQLRLIAASLSSDPDDLRTSWPLVKILVEPLYKDATEPELRRLRNLAMTLDNALSGSDEVSVSDQFRRFRSQAREKFYRVDLSLKRQCDELPAIAAPLDAVLGELQ